MKTTAEQREDTTSQDMTKQFQTFRAECTTQALRVFVCARAISARAGFETMVKLWPTPVS